MTSANDQSDRCPWCHARIGIASGRIVFHRQLASGFGAGFDAEAGIVAGDACPLSDTIPWRRGTPDEATVRRHLQAHPSVDSSGALFQVRWMGLFHGVIVASFDAERVVWGYLLPCDADNKLHGGPVTPPPTAASGIDAWDFRPLDLHTGEPRVWIDTELAK